MWKCGNTETSLAAAIDVFWGLVTASYQSLKVHPALAGAPAPETRKGRLAPPAQ